MPKPTKGKKMRPRKRIKERAQGYCLKGAHTRSEKLKVETEKEYQFSVYTSCFIDAIQALESLK